jgi:hypothetical protein
MSKHTFNSKLLSTTAALALVGGLSLTAACDPGEPDTVDQPRAASIDPTPQLTADIEGELEGEVEAVVNPSVAPEQGSLEDRIMALQPQKTRAGWLRFTDPIIHDEAAAAILLERLVAGDDPPLVRAALAEAVGRTGGDYAAAVSELIPTEADARVREMLVGTLGRQAPGAEAHAGLTAGLQDDDAAVRGAAARTLAARSDGAVLAEGLLGLLADPEPAVRADAARSLGVLEVEAAKAPLVELLADADAEVRLQGLRALDRIDPAYATSLGELASLEQDGDARVQRLATKIRQR